MSSFSEYMYKEGFSASSFIRVPVYIESSRAVYAAYYSYKENDTVAFVEHIENRGFPGYQPGSRIIEVFQVRYDQHFVDALPDEVKKHIEKQEHHVLDGGTVVDYRKLALKKHIIWYELARLVLLHADELVLAYCKYQNIRSHDPNYWIDEMVKDWQNEIYARFYRYERGDGQPFVVRI